MMKIEADKKAYMEEKYGKKEEVKYSDDGTKHDIEVLKAGIPDGVDPKRKQDYLSDAQFE
jgi:hypothetical protein